MKGAMWGQPRWWWLLLNVFRWSHLSQLREAISLLLCALSEPGSVQLMPQHYMMSPPQVSKAWKIQIGRESPVQSSFNVTLWCCSADERTICQKQLKILGCFCLLAPLLMCPEPSLLLSDYHYRAFAKHAVLLHLSVAGHKSSSICNAHSYLGGQQGHSQPCLLEKKMLLPAMQQLESPHLKWMRLVMPQG